MATVIICSIILIASLVFSLVQWFKGNHLYMWLGIFVALIALSIGVPAAIDLIKEYTENKINGVFKKFKA